MKEYEFYIDQTGCFCPEIYNLEDPEHPYNKMDQVEIAELFDHICRFPYARRALGHLSRYFNGDRRKILSQFIKCNWCELDNYMDVGHEALHYEKMECQHKNKGTCPFQGEGVVCVNLIKEELPMLTEK